MSFGFASFTENTSILRSKTSLMNLNPNGPLYNSQSFSFLMKEINQLSYAIS